MKKNSIFFVAIIVMFMTSCGNGLFSGKTVIVSPASEKINGPLGDYFSVVNRDYKVADGSVRIEIKRVQDGFPAPWKKNMSLGYSDGCYEPSFTAEFLDETGNVVYKATTSVVSQKDELQFLAANKLGESGTITFRVEGDKISKVRMSSLFEVHEAETPTTATELGIDSFNELEDSLQVATEEVLDQVEGLLKQAEEIELKEEEEVEEVKEKTKTSGNSNNWDKILDEYEQYVDSYIRLMKKAQSGDIAAIAEYATMLEKAQELADDLEDGKDDMTPTQLKRYAKIAQKLSNAAMQL